jgi:hypothetical protein
MAFLRLFESFWGFKKWKTANFDWRFLETYPNHLV